MHSQVFKSKFELKFIEIIVQFKQFYRYLQSVKLRSDSWGENCSSPCIMRLHENILSNSVGENSDDGAQNGEADRADEKIIDRQHAAATEGRLHQPYQSAFVLPPSLIKNYFSEKLF